jgi:hypothetical protein
VISTSCEETQARGVGIPNMKVGIPDRSRMGKIPCDSAQGRLFTPPEERLGTCPRFVHTTFLGRLRGTAKMWT